jgi:HK97 family phage portal protein
MYNTFIPRLNLSVALPAWRVLHVPLFGLDGYKGKSPVRLHMETLGVSVAMTRYGGSFFGNGAKPSGVLRHPGTLSEAAQTRLRNTFDVKYGGLENAHRTMILEEGLDYKQIGIPPEEAQFIESKNFSITDIARIYNVQPHLIGELSRSTNNNIEHQGIEFQTLTMMPYCVRFEQEYTRKLLTSKEKKKFFIEHLMDGLSRGDMAARYNSYSQGVNSGFMNPDEVRERENMNPMPDGKGEEYRWPANTIPVSLVEEFWRSRITAATGKGGNKNGQQTTNS